MQKNPESPLMVMSVNTINEVQKLVSQLEEQEKVIAQLRSQDGRYRSILETTNAVSWELDAETLKFTYVSPQIEALSGYPVEKWTDFDFWASTIHPDERSNAVVWCNTETAKGLDHEIEYRMIRVDGTIVWIRDVVTVISEQEKPTFLRGHFFNIDDRKKAEEDSFAMQALAFQSQKMESLGLMAGGIAHDFNNLLAVILGNTELALAVSNKNASKAACAVTPLLEDIQNAGNQAAELIREMLTYAGKNPLSLQDVHLDDLVLKMWSLLERAHPKAVRLSHDLGSNSVPILADATLVQQVILNLIINASEAMEGNVGAISIRTRLVRTTDITTDFRFYNPLPQSQNCIVLEISDTGRGIDKSTLQKLFEPFYSTKETGRGLGLASAKGIVERHNGTISIKSEIGSGTTFSIYFPAPEQHSSTVPKDDSSEVKTPNCAGSVLVVDDEDGVRKMAERMLSYSGFSVFGASNGYEATKIFEQHHDEIDCVLLDLLMPLMSGEETLEKLRAIDEKVKVVLASGNYDPEDATKLDAYALVQKPYSQKDILDVLSRAIETNA